MFDSNVERFGLFYFVSGSKFPGVLIYYFTLFFMYNTPYGVVAVCLREPLLSSRDVLVGGSSPLGRVAVFVVITES